MDLRDTLSALSNRDGLLKASAEDLDVDVPTDQPESRPPKPRSGDERPSPSDPQKLVRPGPVTWAMAVLVGMGFLVVVSIYDRMRNLRSVATRDAITDYLSKPPGDGLGLSVETVLSGIHVASVVCATLAGAAAVLACWLPTRQREVRLGLTILAPPLLITGMVADGFGASLMVAAIVVLWMPQARDWYAGRAPAPPRSRRPEPRTTDTSHTPPPGQPPVQPPAQQTGQPTGQHSGALPPLAPMSQDRATLPGAPQAGPWAPPSAAPGAPMPGPHPGAHPAPWPTHAWPPYQVSRPRPTQLILAVVVTSIFSGLGFLMGLTALIALRSAPDAVLDAWAKQQAEMPESPVLSDSGVLQVLTITCVVMLVVSLASIALAGWVLVRRRWAAYALTVVSVLIGCLCLLSAIGSIAMMIPAVASFVVAALLRQRVVRDWLDGV